MAANQDIDVRGYYQSLTKKEKGKFLRYLTRKYDYPTSTISAKLCEGSVLTIRKDEEMNIKKAIEEGLWRQ